MRSSKCTSECQRQAEWDYVIQGNRHDMPFAFQVGAVTLPAGHYEVEKDANTGIVLLRGDRNTPGAAFVFNS